MMTNTEQKIMAAQGAMKRVDLGDISPEGEWFRPTWKSVAEMLMHNPSRTLRVFSYVAGIDIPILSGTEVYYRNVARMESAQRLCREAADALLAEGVQPEPELVIDPLRFRTGRDPEFLAKVLKEVSAVWNSGGGIMKVHYLNGMTKPGEAFLEKVECSEYQFGRDDLIPWWLEQSHQPKGLKGRVRETINRLRKEAEDWIPTRANADTLLRIKILYGKVAYKPTEYAGGGYKVLENADSPVEFSINMLKALDFSGQKLEEVVKQVLERDPVCPGGAHGNVLVAYQRFLPENWEGPFVLAGTRWMGGGSSHFMATVLRKKDGQWRLNDDGGSHGSYFGDGERYKALVWKR